MMGGEKEKHLWYWPCDWGEVEVVWELLGSLEAAFLAEQQYKDQLPHPLQ